MQLEIVKRPENNVSMMSKVGSIQPRFFGGASTKKKAKGMKPRTELKRRQSHVIETVKGNMAGFTERQVRYAKLARKLVATLNYPTEENLKYALRQKLLKNCPITVDDVNNAEKIFGKDVAAMKGKLTRKKPNPIRVEVVEFLPEIIEQIRDLILSLDIFCVNNIPMMSSIDRTIRYRSVVPLENRTKMGKNDRSKSTPLFSKASLFSAVRA